jgi:polyphosphate kinase 2 (PPK2 family)
MFVKTSTKLAPWTVIAGDYKWHARVSFAKTIYDRIAKEFPENKGTKTKAKA